MQLRSHRLCMVKLGFYSTIKHDALKPTHFLFMLYYTSQENLNVSFFTSSLIKSLQLGNLKLFLPTPL